MDYSVIRSAAGLSKHQQQDAGWKKSVKTLWNSHWTADISLLLVALIWGSTYSISKDIVATIPVFEFLFIRFTLTVLLMLPFTVRLVWRATAATWINGLIFGLFLLIIYSLETFGVVYTSASNAGFIISLCVVLVPIVDSIVYRKLPRISLMGAVLLSTVGTGLLTLKAAYVFNPGDFLILGAALFRAIQMTVTKKLTEGKEIEPGALTTIQLLVVAVGAGIISFAQHPASVQLSPKFWLITGYLAVFATIFAFYVQLVMIRRTSPARVALLLSSEPLFGAMFAMLLMGEHLSFGSLIGGACIILGMIWGRRLQSEKNNS
ncbi:EamA family transporter [Aneurinibacillus sp. Ricciae_BoGa-3]|uniref:DMT family transporter n=1 Tax=Aneurinibacillus sp. Ricciae_BoGa-3 TaxID=3022697 RepID=UPI00234027CE|nr:EamA family transporter [Aneurinibacillus sp. Ricciae_BoGa-3]WCK54465.1 EamA family transporter [Aneurinibacillus sp. Ricciae_BoGa-3]